MGHRVLGERWLIEPHSINLMVKGGGGYTLGGLEASEGAGFDARRPADLRS